MKEKQSPIDKWLEKLNKETPYSWDYLHTDKGKWIYSVIYKNYKAQVIIPFRCTDKAFYKITIVIRKYFDTLEGKKIS